MSPILIQICREARFWQLPCILYLATFHVIVCGKHTLFCIHVWRALARRLLGRPSLQVIYFFVLCCVLFKKICNSFISRVPWSLWFPTSRMPYHQRRRMIHVLLTGKYRPYGSWSAVVGIHRQVIGQGFICADFHDVPWHVWKWFGTRKVRTWLPDSMVNHCSVVDDGSRQPILQWFVVTGQFWTISRTRDFWN